MLRQPTGGSHGRTRGALAQGEGRARGCDGKARPVVRRTGYESQPPEKESAPTSGATVRLCQVRHICQVAIS